MDTDVPRDKSLADLDGLDTTRWHDVQGPKAEMALPDMDVGRWYQADEKNCATFCGIMGRANVGSPLEQARCMSGEVRPASGVAAGIKFTWGCPSACAVQSAPLPSSSYGTDCYLPTQKQDGDDTDRTVGCYCK